MSMLKRAILDSVKAKNSLLLLEKDINNAAKKIYQKIKNGGKIFLCGNGGSAADAQHLAAEFLVRLRPHINRKPIAAISLAMDTSTLTACGNDYSFNKIFSRNLKALSNSNDVLIAISTSGNSKNIIDVLKTAKKMKIFSVSFLGNNGGIAKKYSDINLIVNSRITARIQESHIFLGHYIFECVEDMLLKNNLF
jgi:D-sedoheptulose 7-phosphate isomerase